MSLFKFMKLNSKFYTRQNFKILFTRTFTDIHFEDIPEVSPAFIKKTLKSHNITYEEGFTCFITSCPLCKNDTIKTNLPKIYINKSTGMFMCASCKYSGQWDFLERHFIPPKKKKNSKNQENSIMCYQTDKWLESLNKIRSNTDTLLSTSDKLTEILLKFRLPVVSSNSLENIDVRIDKDFNNLYFPLENVESSVVGYRKLNFETGQDQTDQDDYLGGLLTGRPSKNRDTAVLVSSLSDFLVLLNSKISQNIICLPNGVNNLSPYFLPSLERFKKLILWFGNDLKSWNASRQFAKKLGEKRCLFVRSNEKHASPHLADCQDFKSIINTAQPVWHKSITTFASLRQDILLDLQNIDKVQGIKWKRYPTLNKILGGHRAGELTVITGPTGCGKTTFISEYSLDLALQGVNTLWGSFEIRNARLARTMLQQLAGIPLDENLHLFNPWADKFEQLPVYFMTFHGQQTIKVVMEAVEHATYVHDITHVIIDNVQFMMGISEEQKHMDRFWKQDAIIAAFRTFATRKNCHVTLVIHPRKERDDEDLTTSSIFGGAKATQEADNVLIIQDKRLTSLKGKKYLQVVKNRYSGDLGIMTLDFDKSSLSYSQKQKKKDVKDVKPAATKETTSM